jgi:hypothetical protein
MSLPKWSFLVCNASAFLTPLMVTLLIEIPFSLFNQMGFLSRFENASFALPLKSSNLFCNALLTPISITLSNFKSGLISFLIV